MITLFTGSRRGCSHAMQARLAYEVARSSVVIVGDSTGVDFLVAEAANYLRKDLVVVDAEWDKYGPSAGPRRNQAMVDLVKATRAMSQLEARCLAFPDESSKGTWDCVRRAKKAGIATTHLHLAPTTVMYALCEDIWGTRGQK